MIAGTRRSQRETVVLAVNRRCKTAAIWSFRPPAVLRGLSPADASLGPGPLTARLPRVSSAEVIARHREAGRRFEAGGVASFVLDHGDGEPVLCVHGAPTSSFLYRKVIAELSAHGLRGVAFDLPGLGLADRPEHFDCPGPGWDDSPRPQSMPLSSSASISSSTTSVVPSGSSSPR